MKTIVYLIVLLVFLLPSGARLEPSGMPMLRDTIPSTDTLPILKADSSLRIADSLLITGDSLSSFDSFTLVGKPVKGMASYYSKKFEGRKTATGAIFRHSKLTAASNQFPLNSMVRVTNLKNNKSIIVLINDRMHNKMKKKGRVVDLTRNAAKELDFVKTGIARVMVQAIIPYTKKPMGISSE
ncbi:septal ring lytic transglycosylase RlpA family protein [Sediminibacterium goheungense]|uniref:Probable endolytic peptidoglycan transglycosylase RlpA n=1 Tax=Sediminibacterium goheungense TaxID=1086393 RepID=A0A4R6ITC1_9BACT|nr:septal ring lytic transglycosylase RlpA family protein [Sediminibacterium goheungense]TDO25779.1 rare lipoprotein A [Sediminibacterium goheungense]